MSTTFGVYLGEGKIKLEDDDLPEGYFQDDFVEVAFRGNRGQFSWRWELGKFLPDKLSVYPLDNTAQGIYCIGDIKKEMEEQNGTV
jgi:hypothetical protein